MRFRQRDEVEIRPPGRQRVYIEDFDELVIYRYGRAWLHVEQMNNEDFYVALYGEGKKRLHMNVSVDKKRKGAGKTRVTIHENSLLYNSDESPDYYPDGQAPIK